MTPSPPEAGLQRAAAASRRCPATAISATTPSSATSRRSGSATGSMSAARQRPRRAALLPHLPARHARGADRARRARRAARLPQHLPPSRLAALRASARAAEGAADHLPLPFLVLFAARRPGAGALEGAAGRLRPGRTIRSTRWRCRNGAASSSSTSTPLPTRTPATSFDPASADLGNWPLESWSSAIASPS